MIANAWLVTLTPLGEVELTQLDLLPPLKLSLRSCCAGNRLLTRTVAKTSKRLCRAFIWVFCGVVRSAEMRSQP